MPLTIREIRVYALRIPLSAPFKISLGILTHAENILVRIRTEEGIWGTGECSPFATINGENSATCMAAAPFIARPLLGADASDFAECHRLMNQAFYGNNSFKSALDMALYDIAAQAAGMPLFRYLGASECRPLETDYTVSLDKADKMASDAKEIVARGFSVIKVKLGGLPEEDIERIFRIRDAVGMHIPLRIDANQGWTPASTLHILNELAAQNIQHCEEPIPRGHYTELPAIRAQSPIPIMSDESCCDLNDLNRLIALKACDRINIKLGKSAGIYPAIQMIRTAEQAQLPIQLGGFLESRLAFTAATHLAACCSAAPFIDFDTCLMFEEDPVSGGIEYMPGGCIQLADLQKPGIGAVFHEEYLSQLPVITLH